MAPMPQAPRLTLGSVLDHPKKTADLHYLLQGSSVPDMGQQKQAEPMSVLMDTWFIANLTRGLLASLGEAASLDPRPYQLANTAAVTSWQLSYTGQPLSPAQERLVRQYIDFVRSNPT